MGVWNRERIDPPQPDAWTLDELLILRRNYGRRENAWLARALQRSVEDIQAKAAELALAKDKARFKGRPMPRWTAEQVARLSELYADTPNLEIAREFGRSVKSVASKAHALGLVKSAAHRRAVGQGNILFRRDWISGS